MFGNITRGSDFIFDSAQLLNYKCPKVNFTRSGSNVESPCWIKSKKATTNPNNEDDKCFQYGTTVVLNHEEIKRLTKNIKN